MRERKRQHFRCQEETDEEKPTRHSYFFIHVKITFFYVKLFTQFWNTGRQLPEFRRSVKVGENNLNKDNNEVLFNKKGVFEFVLVISDFHKR
jgi:hypothetical protein